MARPTSPSLPPSLTALRICSAIVLRTVAPSAILHPSASTQANLSPWRRETVPWHDIQASRSRPVVRLFNVLCLLNLGVLSHLVSRPWPSGSHRIVHNVFVADRISHNFFHNRRFVVWFHSIESCVVLGAVCHAWDPPWSMATP